MYRQIVSGIIAGIAAYVVFVTPGSSTAASCESQFLDKVDLGTATRYYIHLDRYGSSPTCRPVTRLAGAIMAGDEIAVRFYPNDIFSIESSLSRSADEEIGGFLLFPVAEVDTPTVHIGYGAVTFATREAGAFRLRIANDSTVVQIGEEIPLEQVDNLSPGRSRDAPELTSQLRSAGFEEEWEVYRFEDVMFEKGAHTLEVFLIASQKGTKALLIDRIKTFSVVEEFKNVTLVDRADLSAPTGQSMEKRPENGFFQGIIPSINTVAGVHMINVRFDYVDEAWNARQAPLLAKGVNLLHEGQTVPVERQRDLPSRIRVRAGFGVFDEATEVRLITNIVTVLWPEQYFAEHTPFLKRVNPTIGAQIGGTGSNDLVFMVGVSLKLIDQADFVAGLRFGVEDENQTWRGRRNFYFGATLDPGLFGTLRGHE